jgi:hypothetical protein
MVLFAVGMMQTLTLCICEKNDAFAHFTETSRMITASRHSSAECANGAWRGLFLCPVVAGVAYLI